MCMIATVYQDVEEGSGDLGPHYMNLYENFTRANETTEHRVDFVTWTTPLWHLFLVTEKAKMFRDSGSSGG